MVSYRMQCRMGTVNFLRKTTVTFTYLSPLQNSERFVFSVLFFFAILDLEKTSGISFSLTDKLPEILS